MQMNVLIADDEPGMRLILRKKIEKTEGFTLVGEAVNGEEAVSLFQELHPQVVFLDVDMPKRNGIECARAIQDMNPAAIIIFATAHEEYREEAFEVYAFDYLVKPFNLERLEQTLERILKTRKPAQSKPLPKPAVVKPVEGRLMLKHKDGIAFIDQQEILLVQREDRATVIYTEDGQRYLLSETLSETEARLDPAIFFRCHKSYIINLRRIRNITPYGRWTYVVQLEKTDHDALITYQKYEELEQRFS
ncbi:MAG: response regulator transcription factor [Clostridia bacterium]|nr:response regulator transcription factor [Clostridia bacterium]MBR2053957.1 response regulator transcription factor [Clostridia bacterium]MBR6752872.1 response regulator transcription factor [Clostridia bacterium]